jgi:glutaredoxin 3
MSDELTTVVYSKPQCSYCVKAKNLLQNKGIKFVEKIIGQDISVETLLEEFKVNGLPAPRTAPQIIMHGKYVGGYDALVEYMENTNLNVGNH